MPELIARLSFGDEAVLLHELNHRINNEFAAAISAVSVAAARSSDHAVKAALSGVRELLHHYADVHLALQTPHCDRPVDAATYLHQLCLSISRSKLDDREIKLVLSVQSLQLPAERCLRLGMILYELITNAARHALESGGEIRVAVRCGGVFVKCSVQDNGSAAPSIQPGRGLQIVDALSKALGGRFKQTFGPRGSRSLVVLPSASEPIVIAGRTGSAMDAKPEARCTSFRRSLERDGVL
ncbi:MAG TPA: sensor histidine kinase [Xanthobacteraceae bacterium]|jgi:two-component sensor histidine kinase